MESALQVDLSKETVRLPLYKGDAQGKTVWFVLLDASDSGLAHDLGINFAPKLGNIGIGCPECVQTVTLDAPTPAAEPVRRKPSSISKARPISARPRRATRARRVPAGPVPARSSRRSRLQPVHPDRRFADGVQRADRRHRRRPVRRRSPHEHRRPRPRRPHRRALAPGQFAESWVDMLFVKGFDAGQPIVYISTDAGQPLTAVLERSTYVPALDKAAYNGGDDFLGSARERLFGFINGQTGADNKQAQGFVHLAKDGHVAEDASASNTAFIDALRNGGDLLNVFGDFPTETDPRHARGIQPAVGRPARPVDQQGGPARPEHSPDRRGPGVQPRRHPTRPAHGCRPRHRAARPLWLRRRRHQLRRDRLHQQAATANLADPVANSQFPPR